MNQIMNKETTPKTPHVHAELIKAWADGAQIQFQEVNETGWTDIDNPSWIENVQYRIKPEETTNEPWKPEHHKFFWWLNRQGLPMKSFYDEFCDSSDVKTFNYGNGFPTKEAAETAAEAVSSLLLAIRENKPFMWNCGSVVKQDLIPKIDVKPEESKWKPGFHKEYWYFDDEGEVLSSIWTDGESDQTRLEFNNCFPTAKATEEAAQLVKTLLIAIRENKLFLRSRENDITGVKENLPPEIDGTRWELKAGEDYWFVGYDGCVYRTDSFENYNRTGSIAFGNYFQTKQDAEEAAKAIKSILALRNNKSFSLNQENDTGTNVASIPEVDGKPLSEEEINQIRRMRDPNIHWYEVYNLSSAEWKFITALRDYKITKIFDDKESILVDIGSENRGATYSKHVTFWSECSDNECVRNALRQIRQEQLDADNCFIENIP